MAKRRAEVEVTLRDRATSGLRRLGGSFGGLTKAIGLVTAAATALATFVGARFLSGAIRSAGDFDEAMSRVGAVTQATTEDLARLRETANEAGATTRFTATEAANGLEELARSGQSASEAIATLEPVLALAAGNNQSVAESAIQVTTALNAFGLAADDAARVSDVYTRAAQRSAQTTGQLSEAMTFVAPVARQAGLDIEQTAALVGRLADQGFRGSLGGTALRNAILQLQDPTSSFRRELSKLGIESDDFIEVLGELADAGQDGEAAIRSLGLRAGPAIQALVSGGKPAIDELVESLRSAEGASSDAAAQLENNLPGAFRSLSSAFDAARRKLVEPLVANLTEDIQKFTARVREFTESEALTKLQQLLTDTFNSARAAVVEFINGVDFAEIQARIVAFVDSARDRLADFQESVQGFRAGFDVVVGSAQVAVGTLRTAFNGLGIIISGALDFIVGAAGRTVQAVDRLTFGLSDTISRTANEIQLIQQDIRNSTREFIASAAEGSQQIAEGFDRIGNAGANAGRDIQRGARSASDGIDDLEEAARRAADAAGGASEEFKAWSAEQDKLAEAARRAAEAVDESSKSIQNFETVTGDFGNGIETKVIPQVEGLGDAGEDAGEKLEDAGEAGEKGLDRTRESAGRARRSVLEVGDSADEASRRVVSLSGLMQATLGQWENLSEGAARAADRFRESIDRSVNSVAGFLTRLRTFNEGIEKQQAEQQAEADRLIERYNQVGFSVEEAARAQALLNRELLLLDDSRVQSLQSAIQAVADESRRAREEAADLVASLETDLLRLQGKTDEIERRRLDAQREQIELQLRSGEIDRETRDNLQQALSLLGQQQAIRRQQAEETDRAAQSNERAADAAEREADAVERLSRSRPTSAGPTRIELEIRSIGGDPGAPILSQADIQSLAGQLTPLIIERIRAEFRTGL